MVTTLTRQTRKIAVLQCITCLGQTFVQKTVVLEDFSSACIFLFECLTWSWPKHFHLKHVVSSCMVDTAMNGCISKIQWLYLKIQIVTYDGTVWHTSKINVWKQITRDNIQIGSIRQNFLAETFYELNNTAVWNNYYSRSEGGKIRRGINGGTKQRK